MKETEILPLVKSGKPVVVAEFRDWEVKDRGGNVIESTYLLLGRETISVERFAPKGAKVTDVSRPPFKAGQKVVWQVEKLERTKWGTQGKGAISAAEFA